MKSRIAAFVLATAGVLSASGAIESPLPRSTPEAQGIPSEVILNFVAEAEAKVHALHSFMLVRHGQVVAEGWWAPNAPDEPHILNSLSKSFTSTAIGLLIAEGKLNLDDPVLKFFPEEAPANPGAELKAMRVRHLLAMSTGHRKEDIEAFQWSGLPFLPQPNLVRNFLAMPVTYAPGTHFAYDSCGSYMLSAIVQKITGQTTRDYLGPRLFVPLGIETPDWQESPQGISYGGFGLSLRTEDVAKFGQLYLQKGKWGDRQLLPADWVDAATSKQTENRTKPDEDHDWAQGYGYQFWRCRHGFYRGDGARGQFCIVMPQYDAVIAITSDTPDMAGEMELVWNVIVPAFKDAPLPADAEATARLSAKLRSLKL